jgi:DNA repair exonuclease SbcCD ATPase subunit
MPTGYTAKLVESGQTFEEFVLTCARAFGACIEMRDEPLSKPVPEKFEVNPWHKNQLRAAKAELTRLKKLTATKKKVLGEKQRAQEIKSHEQYIQKQAAENARINQMILKVKAWEPPTPDHQGIKDFMLEQLNMSLGSSEYSERSLAQAKTRKPLDYYQAALRSAERDIKYHEEKMQEEVTRTDGRSDWVRQLRESIK